MKRFAYTTSGGVKKIDKHIDLKPELVIQPGVFVFVEQDVGEGDKGSGCEKLRPERSLCDSAIYVRLTSLPPPSPTDWLSNTSRDQYANTTYTLHGGTLIPPFPVAPPVSPSRCARARSNILHPFTRSGLPSGTDSRGGTLHMRRQFAGVWLGRV